MIERAVLLSRSEPVTSEDLPIDGGPRPWSVEIAFEEGRSLHEVKRHVARQLILEALRRAAHKSEAARLLGISRHALAYQLKSLTIDCP